MSSISFVGIDYSGAATPESRLAGLQVYRCQGTEDPIHVRPDSHGRRVRNWNRLELTQWLIECLNESGQALVGIDHGLSFPQSYFKKHQLKTWHQFLDDFVQHWPTHQSQSTVQQFRVGNRCTGNPKELRLTEQWTSSAKSVFQFDVQGSVAKSTHAGLPLLKMIREQVPNLFVWPFDGWDLPTDQPVIFETYPSLFRNRYQRNNRTVDQQDAYAICRWLRDMDRLDRLHTFAAPPLSDQQKETATLEGWIFGVL